MADPHDVADPADSGDPIVFVFAKEPRPGRVKTRLCPPLSPTQAARCHRAFTADTVTRLAAAVPRLCVAASPDRSAPWLEALARRAGADLVWQGDGDLGRRMERVLRRSCRRGGSALVVGSDVPDLPMGYVGAALDALAASVTVLGPSDDGGYYLIGCSARVPPVFSLNAQWGSRDVLAETLERLRAAGGRAHVLPQWEDVDDFAALRRLAGRLAAQAGTAATETLHLIADLKGEGVPL